MEGTAKAVADSASAAREAAELVREQVAIARRMYVANNPPVLRIFDIRLDVVLPEGT